MITVVVINGMSDIVINIVPSNPFRFEEFPDEISLEFFQYVKLTDLHSFFGHNRRMNTVVQDIKLNVIIECLEDDHEDRNYLALLLPNQFIGLEMRYRWQGFDLNSLKELRFLSVNCLYLLEDQFDQLLTVNLPHLERFSIDNVPHYYVKQLFRTIIDNEHFPSLKVCQFSGEYYEFLEHYDHNSIPNQTIRMLTLNRCDDSQLGQLMKLLPNLRRFETNLQNVTLDSLDFNVYHNSLEHLRLTVEDPLNDLKIILPYVPILKQLRVRGKITEDSISQYFKALAKIFRSQVSNLQKFDCELYFHARTDQAAISTIQQLHPLFKKIQCHSGTSINQCYATDLDSYPSYSEYSYIERQRSYDPPTLNWNVMGGYDSDPYDDDHGYGDRDSDDNNGFIDYGLGYRGNYKANYGSSPWSGNND